MNPLALTSAQQRRIEKLARADMEKLLADAVVMKRSRGRHNAPLDEQVQRRGKGALLETRVQGSVVEVDCFAFISSWSIFDNFFNFLWTGFGLALTVTLVMTGFHGIKVTYFFLMILYGMATFIAGVVLRFQPMVFGGLCSLTCAVFSVFLGDEEQLLCLALALLLSYIVPGHLLASHSKRPLNV